MLGLIHTEFSHYDLMWGVTAGGWDPIFDLVRYPSTVDLYALYTLAAYTSHEATLPNNITYETYQGNGIYESALPLPEFPSGELVTFFSSVIMLGLILRVKGRKQHQALAD